VARAAVQRIRVDDRETVPIGELIQADGLLELGAGSPGSMKCQQQRERDDGVGAAGKVDRIGAAQSIRLQ